ncbi:MAG: efflux RND transporter periplasmic adaptor subunit [Rikenellaceae bacterium]
MIKRNSIYVAVLTAFAIGLCSCQEQQQLSVQPKAYDLQTITPTNFASSSSYTASVKGRQDIDIYPQVSGYLSQIAVTEGQTVKKGDLLFVIEQAPYIAAHKAAVAGVEVAKASLATAELNYSNSKSLKLKGIISESELTTANNTLKSAKAQLSVAEAQELSAKTNLDFTRIVSPSEGVVGKIPYRKGTLVSSALPQGLTVISDNSQMYVYFSMSENQVYNLMEEYGSMNEAIANMSDLELKLSNGTTYNHRGALESISGMLDSSTGAVSLRAVFDNPERRLLSGSTASVIVPELFENAVVIPKAATFDLQDKIFVYKVVDGVAKSAPITVSKSMNSTEYVVTSGLNMGDVIISAGAGLVREGTPVKQDSKQPEKQTEKQSAAPSEKQ